MINRNIRVHSHPAVDACAGTLLFVHGGYVNSTCWEFNFIPFFRGHGYDCFAVDLSGHGASEGRERIDEFGIDDYAADVATAVREIGRPVILIGHSMGARVLERYLEKEDAVAAAFLAPVPTTGTAGSALQLALRYPAFFDILDQVAQGRFSEAGAELMTRVYFSPQVSAAEALQFLPMVGPESQLAVTEMALVQPGLSQRRRKLPALVMGGENDAVFPASMLYFSALPWGAEVHRIPGAGHMLMLDPQWEDAAGRLLAWLKSEAKLPEVAA